jgi:DNA repair protein RAD7
VPAIESLTLLNASQFQNDVMDYFIQRVQSLRKLHLHSANLIDDNHWQSFFTKYGDSLESIRLEFLDEFFTLDTVKVMVKCCPRLKSLRLEHLGHLKDDAVRELAKLTELEHLTVRLGPGVDSETLVTLIETFGRNLRTLAIKECDCLDHSVLTAIRMNCQRITCLKLSGIETLPFSAFLILFDNWENLALTKVDLSSVHTLDSSEKSDGDAKVAETHGALKALMAHSGKRLEKLDLHSSRPISHEDLCSTFAEGSTYPCLREIDLSFVQAVDDFVVGSLVRCCPNLEFLTVSVSAPY